jgi:hypothetical protein
MKLSLVRSLMKMCFVGEEAEVQGPQGPAPGHPCHAPEEATQVSCLSTYRQMQPFAHLFFESLSDPSSFFCLLFSFQ